MKRDLRTTKNITSSFLSCEKDTETILRKLFISSQPYSDILKRLLVINTEDCLTNTESEVYKTILKKMSISELFKQGYVKMSPKIRMAEHDEIKSYLIITFDNFTMNATNPEFRDCTVYIDIICHTDCWELEDYQLRPLKIAGYVDGLLDGERLSGIGKFHFMSCNHQVLNEDLSGYTLAYRAVHGSDDSIPPKED